MQSYSMLGMLGLPVVVWLMPIVSALPMYQTRIPNGASVMGDSGLPWPGVGHLSDAGGGPLNPFGMDFQAAGHMWSVALCQKDSDGDGRTNGQELGDPNCVWQVGETPEFTTGITNPGIPSIFSDDGPTPYNDIPTPPPNFCPSNTSGLLLDTVEMKITFPMYNVPPQRTTYAKMGFHLNTTLLGGSASFWIVKFTPIIENPNVVHHILLYSCTRKEMLYSQEYFAKEPTGNGDSAMSCASLVFGWAIGGNAFCMPQGVAMNLTTDDPWLLMEIHYNNPSLTSGIMDSSGFSISGVTNEARKQQGLAFRPAGFIWVGARIGSVRVPAFQGYWEVSSMTRLSYAGAHIPDSGLQVYAYLQHAHQYATKLWTTIDSPTRNSTFVIGCNPSYDFNLQQIIPVKDPFWIYRDDIITAHCSYSNPTGLNVYGGESSGDEMCIHFLLADAVAVPLNKLSGKVTNSPQLIVSPTGETVTCGASLEQASTASWILGHGIMMTLGWGLLIPIGALFPVFFRESKRIRWFPFHRAFVSVGSLCALVGFIIAFSNAPNEFVNPHERMGLVVFCGMILQVLFAIARPHAPDQSQPEKTMKRKVFEKFHSGLARVMLVLASLNLIGGFDILGFMGGNELLGVGFGLAIAICMLLIVLKLTWNSIRLLFRKKEPVVEGIGEDENNTVNMVALS